MCEVCGCGDTTVVTADVHVSLLSGNERAAAHNRDHFAERGITAINLMGSPGSGKTAMLEATARQLGSVHGVAALSGDLATDYDAERLRRAGIRSRAITTGNACHLDANMVHRALHELEHHPFDLLFVENVGNLVCPAIYDLGQAANVVALSVTEGEDKPLKYPIMFQRADLVLLTKIELLPHLDVSLAGFEQALRRVMPAPAFIPVSARTLQGVNRWIEWLSALRARPRTGPNEPREERDAGRRAYSEGSRTSER